MKKAVFNWSGGKDSALALQKVLEEKEFEVTALLTTMNEETFFFRLKFQIDFVK